MKKIYFLLVLVLSLAVRLSAQTAIESITVLNWDGSELEGNMLFLGVGETKTLKLAVQPADADLSTISLGMELLDDDLENGGPMAFHGMNITAYKGGTRTLYIYSNRKQMTSVVIEAWYEETGPLYDDGRKEGQVYYSINTKGQLQFWAEELDKSRPEDSNIAYDIPEYKYAEDAPWYGWRESINEVILDNLDNIGDNAFNDLTNLCHITFPYTIQSLGANIFLGCSILRTMEVERFSSNNQPYITSTTGESLIIDDEDPQNPVRPDVVIVKSEYAKALAAYSSADSEWSLCGKVIESGGTVPGEANVQYEITPSESSEGIQLTLMHNGATGDVVLPDRTDETYPWDELGDLIEDLNIGDRIRYIGSDVFSTLTNLQTIQFNQSTAPIDSINLWAFSMEIFPWKFAFGNPQDGPICPPKIVGGPENEEEMMHHAMDIWSHFRDNTVLYVPDSTFEYQGAQVRAVDLYRNDPIWGEVFNRITDRTVEIERVDSGEVVLKWLPLENAKVYRLTIRQPGCSDCGEVTLEIPAFGVQGLVDWDQMPNNSPVRRAPREDDHGGMTITITVQDGTGTAHNNDISVTVTGMKEGKSYSYSRDVEKSDGVDLALSKEGSIDENTNGIDNVYAGTGEMKIYDLLGRSVNCAVEDLPEGIYIFTDGVTRTKIFVRR